MAKIISVLLVALLLAPPKKKAYQVEYVGKLKDIMMNGDLSAKVAIDTLISRNEHLYGIGPADGLKGEVIILNSKPAVCYMEDGKPKLKEGYGLHASQLVYANIEEYEEINVPSSAYTMKQFEAFLKKKAMKLPEDPNEPFPFLLKIENASVKYHIIDWKDGVTHTHDNHKQFAHNGRINGKRVTILGFYAEEEKYQGIFVKKDEKMHLHVIAADKSIIGHVDDFTIHKGGILSLPVR